MDIKSFGFSFKMSWKNKLYFLSTKKRCEKENVTGQDLNLVCGHIYFIIPKYGCEKCFFVVFLQKNGKINQLVSLSNGHGKIKLYFLSTKKKSCEKKNVTGQDLNPDLPCHSQQSRARNQECIGAYKT